jgi:hypothetical protein
MKLNKLLTIIFLSSCMKLTKTINVQGTIVPAGTELHFSNEGIGYYNGIEVKKDLIPEVATEAIDRSKFPKLNSKNSPVLGYWLSTMHMGPGSHSQYMMSTVYSAKQVGRLIGKTYQAWENCSMAWLSSTVVTGLDSDRVETSETMSVGIKLIVWTWDTRKVNDIIDLTEEQFNLINNKGRSVPDLATPLIGYDSNKFKRFIDDVTKQRKKLIEEHDKDNGVSDLNKAWHDYMTSLSKKSNLW